MRRAWGLLACGLLIGCAHAVPATPVATSGVEAAGLALTPEKAEGKARKLAAAWRADARLVGVAWAVPKTTLASVAYHVFAAADADTLFVVETKLTSWWQASHEVADTPLVLGAKVLADIEAWPVDATKALAIGKAQAPGNDHPVAMLALGRVKLAPPVWGVTADATRCLVHAETGRVIMGGGQAVALLERVVGVVRRAD